MVPDPGPRLPHRRAERVAVLGQLAQQQRRLLAHLRTAALQMSLRAQFDKIQKEVKEEEGRPLDAGELEAFYLTYAALGPSAEA